MLNQKVNDIQTNIGAALFFQREKKKDKATWDISNVAHEVQMSCHMSNQLCQGIMQESTKKTGQ